MPWRDELLAAQRQRAEQAPFAIAAIRLRRAELGDHHILRHPQWHATELTHQALDFIHERRRWHPIDPKGQFNYVANDAVIDLFLRLLRKGHLVQFGHRLLDVHQSRRGGIAQQRTHIDPEGRRQVPSGAIKHRLAGFGALDGGDRDAQMPVQAGLGQGFLTQAMLFAQSFQRHRVQQHTTVGYRGITLGQGSKGIVSGVHVDNPSTLGQRQPIECTPAPLCELMKRWHLA